MKRMMIAIAIIASILLVTNASALQQIAGPIIISVKMGETGTAQYGLVNDDNETITVSLRAEGDVAKYLSFPETLNLTPNKIEYINITAAVPADYNVSLGRNITGFVYALQTGKPGQVQINVQLMKSVTITVLEPTKRQVSPITGLITFVSENSFVVVLIGILVVIAIVFVLFKNKRKGR